MEIETKQYFELPGPWGLPIFGSILNLSGKQQGKVLANWADEYYGPIFRLRVGSRQFVALQGYDLIKEALVTKANSFSGRMEGEIFDMLRTGKGLFMTDMNNNFKYWHSFANQGLAATWETFQKGIRMEAKYLETYVCEHLNQGIDLQNILSLVMMNSVMKMCFSRRFAISENQADDLYKKVYKSVSDPKWKIIGILPWLKHFPSFHRFLSETEKHSKDGIAWIKKMIEERRNSVECSSIDLVTCYDQSFQEFKHTEEVTSEDHFATFIADLLFAGSSTTANQLLWVLLFLLKNPDCMEKVREELNTLKETSVDAINTLHYTRAVIYETLRLRPISPTGSVHKTTQNARLMGYEIPKNTNIIANLWSVHMDKTIWGSEPEAFRPERHLDEDGIFHKSEYMVTFSMGLRKCVGERLAKAEMTTFLISLLSKFELNLADESRDVDLEGVPETIFKPKPFKIVFGARQNKQQTDPFHIQGRVKNDRCYA